MDPGGLVWRSESLAPPQSAASSFVGAMQLAIAHEAILTTNLDWNVVLRLRNSLLNNDDLRFGLGPHSSPKTGYGVEEKSSGLYLAVRVVTAVRTRSGLPNRVVVVVARMTRVGRVSDGGLAIKSVTIRVHSLMNVAVAVAVAVITRAAVGRNSSATEVRNGRTVVDRTRPGHRTRSVVARHLSL